MTANSSSTATRVSDSESGRGSLFADVVVGVRGGSEGRFEEMDVRVGERVEEGPLVDVRGVVNMLSVREWANKRFVGEE
jgi:hypothetical protein